MGQKKFMLHDYVNLNLEFNDPEQLFAFAKKYADKGILGIYSPNSEMLRSYTNTANAKPMGTVEEEQKNHLSSGTNEDNAKPRRPLRTSPRLRRALMTSLRLRRPLMTSSSLKETVKEEQNNHSSSEKVKNLHLPDQYLVSCSEKFPSGCLALVYMPDKDKGYQYAQCNPQELLSVLFGQNPDNFENFIYAISIHVEKIRSFLDLCISGNLEKDFFMTFMRSFKSVVNWNFVDQENPRLGLKLIKSEQAIPLEFAIETEIFFALLFDQENKLEHTKLCIQCGDYYQARGKKSKHCSERCRSRTRYAAKKKEAKKAIAKPVANKENENTHAKHSEL